MTKYIQNKNGQMAGSIGDGKDKVPTAAALVTSNRQTLDEFIAAEPGVADAWERFQAAKQEAAAATAAKEESEEAAAEAAWQAEIQAERAAQQADPTRLAPLDGSNPAIDAISHQTSWPFTRRFDGAAFRETNDLVAFAGSAHEGTRHFDRCLFRLDITEKDGYWEVKNQMSNSYGPPMASTAIFHSRAEANSYIRAAGRTIEADLSYLTRKYAGITEEQRTGYDSNTRSIIRDLTETGLYTETQDPGSKYINDDNRFTIAGTGRRVRVSHLQNPWFGRYHIAYVYDEDLGSTNAPVYAVRFRKMDDARLFAQDMLLAAAARN
jgi:hypothetical protein